MLFSRPRSAARVFGSVVPLSPNSRSNTRRGLFSIGSGCVAVRQAMVFVYALPVVSMPSTPSSSDASSVWRPNSCAMS